MATAKATRNETNLRRGSSKSPAVVSPAHQASSISHACVRSFDTFAGSCDRSRTAVKKRDLLLLLFAVLATGEPAWAAEVRGRVERGIRSERYEQLGYVRTRITQPREDLEREESVAVFLRVVESPPLEAPEEPQILAIRGTELIPSVASCAVDGQVVFANEDAWPVEVQVDGRPLATIPPGEERTYPCTAGSAERKVRLPAWRHARGLIYVGEVGVAAPVNARGRFSIRAPRGTYELVLVTADGVRVTQPLVLESFFVNMGAIVVSKDPPPSAPPTP